MSDLGVVARRPSRGAGSADEADPYADVRAHTKRLRAGACVPCDALNEKRPRRRPAAAPPPQPPPRIRAAVALPAAPARLLAAQRRVRASHASFRQRRSGAKGASAVPGLGGLAGGPAAADVRDNDAHPRRARVGACWPPAALRTGSPPTHGAFRRPRAAPRGIGSGAAAVTRAACANSRARAGGAPPARTLTSVTPTGVRCRPCVPQLARVRHRSAPSRHRHLAPEAVRRAPARSFAVPPGNVRSPLARSFGTLLPGRPAPAATSTLATQVC